MHSKIKLNSNFPLTFLGFECVVKFEPNGSYYTSSFEIKNRIVLLKEEDPKVLERKFQNEVVNYIDSL